MACLRDEQIDHTIMFEPKLVRMGAGDAARNRHILRFYGSLNDDARSALSAGRLRATDLNDEQWALLQKALASKGAAYATLSRDQLIVSLTQSGSDIIEHSFTCYPGQGEEPIVFKLVTGLTYKTKDEIVFPENRK